MVSTNLRREVLPIGAACSTSNGMGWPWRRVVGATARLISISLVRSPQAEPFTPVPSFSGGTGHSTHLFWPRRHEATKRNDGQRRNRRTRRVSSCWIFVTAWFYVAALTARGESPASHRGRRGAPLTRRDDREYREYLREEQRSQPGAPTARTVRRGVERGCIAGRMQPEFHHGLLGSSAGPSLRDAARVLRQHHTLRSAIPRTLSPQDRGIGANTPVVTRNSSREERARDTIEAITTHGSRAQRFSRRLMAFPRPPASPAPQGMLNGR
jgi:hypothetical protein